MGGINHTPGPWSARANGAQWVVDAGREQRVASVNTALMGQEANARLIAAAPELLAALRPFADIGVSENPDYQPMIRMDREAILAARAAIAKAEGRG